MSRKLQMFFVYIVIITLKKSNDQDMISLWNNESNHNLDISIFNKIVINNVHSMIFFVKISKSLQDYQF